MIDASTKFVRLYPTRTTKSSEVVKHLDDYFRAYSRPRCVVSDRGTAFTSAEFENFLKERGVQHIKIATGSPQANGQVERVNRSIGPMLAKLVRPEMNIYWDSVLHRVEHALNNTFHRTIGEHPSMMLFGVGQRGEVADTLKECLVDGVQERTQAEHFGLRQRASERQKKLQDCNKSYVDGRRRPATSYSVGDYVVVKNFDCNVGVSRKLIPKYKGPYGVSKVLGNDRYLLEDVDGFQQSRIPYRGIWAANNMRPWFRGRGDPTRDREISFVRMVEL